MKKITSLLVVLTLTVGCMAQSINFIPNVSSLKEKQDYVEYQELIVDMSNWLSNHKMKDDIEKRREIYEFILAWSIGTPTIMLSISNELHSDIIEDGILMIEYLAACCKYSIESNQNKIDLNMHSNGMNSMLDFYVKNKDMLGKNKKIEQLVKMRNNGKLNKYFEQQMIAHEKNNKKEENESEIEDEIENE